MYALAGLQSFESQPLLPQTDPMVINIRLQTYPNVESAVISSTLLITPRSNVLRFSPFVLATCQSSVIKRNINSEMIWLYGVAVSTRDSESRDPSSNLGTTYFV